MGRTPYTQFSVFSAAFPDHLRQPLEGLPHDELRETTRQVGPDAACHPGVGAQLLPMLDAPTDRGCSAVGDVQTRVTTS